METRRTFDRELHALQDQVLTLGSMVENAIIESVAHLKQQNLEGAREIIVQDSLINKKRYAIEEQVLVLIATQQPMASDLRVLAAMLEIAGELERIADYAKGIGKITLMIGYTPHIKPLIDIPLMAQHAREMLHAALVAFAQRDVAAARAIPKEDDVVDQLYNQVYRELLTYIFEDHTRIEQANQLLWAAHNLERAADRVTNICERVIFTVTGEIAELDVKGELEAPPEV